MPRHRPPVNFSNAGKLLNKLQGVPPAGLARTGGEVQGAAVFSASMTTTSSAVLRVTSTGAANALVVEDSSNPDNSPFVINADGTVIIGHMENVTSQGNQTARVQLHSTDESNELALFNWHPDVTGHARLVFGRSQSNSLGQQTTVTLAMQLGEILFVGSNGVFKQASAIRSEVDRSLSSSGVEGDLSFWTGRSTGSLAKAMDIDSSQNVSISGILNVVTDIRLNGTSVQTKLPVGSVFLTDVNTNPGTLLGYGTWGSLGSGSLFSQVVYSWNRTA